MKDNCLCKHTRGSHFDGGGCNAKKYIFIKDNDGLEPDKKSVEFCKCQTYKRDNLRYLERLSESKDK